MPHKFIGGQRGLDVKKHPTDPKKLLVKLACRPRKIRGEIKTSMSQAMLATEYRKRRYFATRTDPWPPWAR